MVHKRTFSAFHALVKQLLPYICHTWHGQNLRKIQNLYYSLPLVNWRINLKLVFVLLFLTFQNQIICFFPFWRKTWTPDCMHLAYWIFFVGWTKLNWNWLFKWTSIKTMKLILKTKLESFQRNKHSNQFHFLFCGHRKSKLARQVK